MLDLHIHMHPGRKDTPEVFKEKTMAAAAAGVKTVLIPADNMRDLPELDPEALAVLEVLPCRTLTDVLNAALTRGIPKATATVPSASPALCTPVASAKGGNHG